MHFKLFVTAILCVCLTPFGYAEKNNETDPVLTEIAAPIKDNDPADLAVTKEPNKKDTKGDENNKEQVTRQPKKAPKRSPKASPTDQPKNTPKRLAPKPRKKPLTEKQITALEVVVEEGKKLPNLSDQDALHLQRIEEKLLRKKQAGVYLTPKEKKCVWRLMQYRPIQKALDYQEKTVLRRAMEDPAFQGGATITAGIAGTIAAALTAWGVIAATTPADG